MQTEQAEQGNHAPTYLYRLTHGLVTEEEQAQRLADHNARYEVAWKGQGRIIDDLLERYYHGGYEGYSDPHSARGIRLRAKHAAERKGRSAQQVTPKLRFHILQRDGFRCQLCGDTAQISPTCTLHVDHRISVADGGQTVPENLWALCATCNSGKGAQSL